VPFVADALDFALFDSSTAHDVDQVHSSILVLVTPTNRVLLLNGTFECLLIRMLSILLGHKRCVLQASIVLVVKRGLDFVSVRFAFLHAC